MDCEIPVTGPEGAIDFFDLDTASPGDILKPALFDDELWDQGTEREIAWLLYKGDPSRGEQVEHTLDVPFASSTTFKLDLLRSDSSILRNVMPATTLQPFRSEHKDGDNATYTASHTALRNTTCRTNAYAALTYKWTVPLDLDTDPIYHLQLSTNDSEAIHFSGAFRVGSGCDEGMDMGVHRFSFKDGHLLMAGWIAVGALVVLHLVSVVKERRKAGYKVVDSEPEEKEEAMGV